MLDGQRNCVFSDNRLSCRRVCGDKNAVALLQMIDCLLLKCVQFKRPFARHIRDQFSEIDQLIIDINYMSPVTFGDYGTTSSCCGWLSNSARRLKDVISASCRRTHVENSPQAEEVQKLQHQAQAQTEHAFDRPTGDVSMRGCRPQ